MERKVRRIALFAAAALAALSLAGCGGKEPPATPPPPEDEETAVTYRKGYTPTAFSGNVTNETEKLGEGVRLVKNTVVKTNGNTSVVYTVEVDLTKATVRAGTKDNAAFGFGWQKAAPYSTAQAWESATGGKVYASINADFFGGTTVNAFVKDGCIIKAGHNDKGGYDYANEDNDIPASAPFLFGVKGDEAQLMPIIDVEGDPTDPAVKQQIVTAKLSYLVEDGRSQYTVSENGKATSETINLLTEGSGRQSMGYAVKVDTSKGFRDMVVLETVKVEGTTTFTAGEGYAYLQTTGSQSAPAKYLSKLAEGDTVSLSVTSPDGSWTGFETILGCRHTLVEGGKIASTVALEFSNGAKSPDVPRTAVGLLDRNTVVVFAVESMYYGGRAAEGDPHGMNLAELAEFAYFYGCDVAANFDGGGSTQLVVHGDAAARVVVRSSDTGSADLLSTRLVMNSLLVTEKK